MFTWLLPLLTTLLMMSWSEVAHACKCAEPPPPSAALESAQAVFEGEVAAITESGSELVVTLRVPRAWKGIDSAEEIRVLTRKDSAACGFPFAQGEHYLVYAQALEPARDGSALQVLRCGRTRALAEAEEDVRELGLGAIPVRANAPNEVGADEKKTVVERKRDQPAAGGCASCTVGAPQELGRGALVLGWVIVFVGLWRWGRRLG
jgi:hypothetical protein